MSYPRPEGHHIITPGASVPNVRGVIDFIQEVFDGTIIEKYEGPNDTVAHAEVMIGDSAFMLGEPEPGDDPIPAMLSYYVDDANAVDATYRKALAAGATSMVEPITQFYGYRSATIQDVGGNYWTICAVVEQLTPEEINSVWRRCRAIPSRNWFGVRIPDKKHDTTANSLNFMS